MNGGLRVVVSQKEFGEQKDKLVLEFLKKK
jgi:hypothetical protein